MAQKLSKRLENEGINGKDVLEFAWDFGFFEAMGEYHVKSIESMRKFLVETSGDADIVRKCIANSVDNKPIHARIVDELILRNLNIYVANQEKDKRIRFLETQMKLYQHADRKVAIKLLEGFRGREAIPVWK